MFNIYTEMATNTPAKPSSAWKPTCSMYSQSVSTKKAVRVN